VFARGDVVRLVRSVTGMAAGSEGVFLVEMNDGAHLLVSFWDGGPLQVPADAVELGERAGAWEWFNDPRD
jgi:hypothetical protein